jgi:hypothetical protein
MYDNYYSIGTDDDPYGRRLNKNVKLIKDPKLYPDEYYVLWIQCIYIGSFL